MENVITRPEFDANENLEYIPQQYITSVSMSFLFFNQPALPNNQYLLTILFSLSVWIVFIYVFLDFTLPHSRSTPAQLHLNSILTPSLLTPSPLTPSPLTPSPLHFWSNIKVNERHSSKMDDIKWNAKTLSSRNLGSTPRKLHWNFANGIGGYLKRRGSTFEKTDLSLPNSHEIGALLWDNSKGIIFLQ